jgi:hypothetical protein
MAPTRGDGSTCAQAVSPVAMTSARMSFIPSASAPAAAIDVTPIAWQHESSMDSCCLVRAPGMGAILQVKVLP